MGNQAIKALLETSLLSQQETAHTVDIVNGIEGVKFPDEEDYSGNPGLIGGE